MIKEDFAIQSYLVTNINTYFIKENGYINKINSIGNNKGVFWGNLSQELFVDMSVLIYKTLKKNESKKRKVSWPNITFKRLGFEFSNY